MYEAVGEARERRESAPHQYDTGEQVAAVDPVHQRAQGQAGEREHQAIGQSGQQSDLLIAEAEFLADGLDHDRHHGAVQKVTGADQGQHRQRPPGRGLRLFLDRHRLRDRRRRDHVLVAHYPSFLGYGALCRTDPDHQVGLCDAIYRRTSSAADAIGPPPIVTAATDGSFGTWRSPPRPRSCVTASST